MLDAGLTLEDRQTRLVQTLTAEPSAQWRTSPAASFLREGMTANVKGIPLKLAYGSDYPYRTVAGAAEVECVDAHTQPSFAYGGFSTVWGASMMPYLQSDLGKWPVSADNLADHYAAVLQHVPMAGRVDDLAEIFPLHTTPGELPLSAQASSLLGTLASGRDKLRKKGVYAGASRLAARFDGNPPCAKCGLCMYGCPHGLIYAASFTVEKLKKDPRFTYVPGIHVQRVREENGTATVHGHNLSSNQPVTYSSDRVFLGAGVIGTTEILLRSLGAYGRELTLRDSQYFLQPCLRLSGVSGVQLEALHTLAQAYLEIVDKAVSDYSIHLQVYTYNELFGVALSGAAGPLKGLLPANALLSRLILLQGYLHSDESSTLTCSLERTGEGDKLRVKGVTNPETRKVMGKVQRKLMTVSPLTGLVPLLPLLRKGDPGRGFHTGGSFPMKTTPGEFESDVLGRPAGFSRIHAVDSSVFPSIPATTITLTSMANAHRIASQAAAL